MTTPETTPSETASSEAAASGTAAAEVAAQEAARKRMQGRFPKCPPREHFPVVTGFVTPGSDFPPPHPLDASINMDVYDPTETISPGKFERIRVVEVDRRVADRGQLVRLWRLRRLYLRLLGAQVLPR